MIQKHFSCSFTFLILVLLAKTNGQLIRNCPNTGWERFGIWFQEKNVSNECYFISRQPMSWFDALDDCQSKNSSLVSLHSVEDNNLISELISKVNMYMYIPASYWIGFFRDDWESKFRWSDGSAVDYTSWGATANFNEHRCTLISVRMEKNKRESWWDIENCGHRKNYICKRITNENGTNVVTTPAPIERKGGCDIEWYRFEDKCYKPIEESLTFTEANARCSNLYSARLPSIHSKSENNFLTALIGLYNSSSFWIGLKQQNYHYVWIDNSKPDYINWAKGLWEAYRSNCAEIVSNVHKAGQWNPVYCDVKKSFICQKTINKLNQTPSRKITETCKKNENFFKYRDNCYLIAETAMTFQDAQRECAQQGSNLLSITDEYELAFITEEANRLRIGDFWIGLTANSSTSPLFEWIDNSYVYLTNWAPNQPRIDPESGKQCVLQDSSTNKWNSTSACNQPNAYVCEIQLGDEARKNNRRQIGTCPSQVFTNKTEKINWIDVDRDMKSCYATHQSRYSSNWYKGQQMCREYHGHLVSIHSEHEARLLATRFYPGKSKETIWIGLHKLYTGEYKWSDDSEFSYMNWADGEPNQRNFYDTQCVEMNLFDLKWKITSCDSFRSFLCSIEKNYTTQVSLNVTQSRSKAGIIFGLVILFIVIAAIAVFIYTKKYNLIKLPQRNQEKSISNVLYSEGGEQSSSS